MVIFFLEGEPEENRRGFCELKGVNHLCGYVWNGSAVIVESLNNGMEFSGFGKG